MEYISTKLRFAITAPSNWKVHTDSLGDEPTPSLEQQYHMIKHAFLDYTWEEFMRSEQEKKLLLERQATESLKPISAEEAYQKLLDGERAKAIKRKEFKKAYEQDGKRAYQMFFEKLLGMPGDEELEELTSRELTAEESYDKLMADPKTFLVDFETFKQQYMMEQESLAEEARRKQEIEQMHEGLFEASPPENEDYPSVEVVKLKLSRAMTPLELYKLDKPSQKVGLWGNRPSKGIVVDNLQGVKYYYIPDEFAPKQDKIQFLNVYLTESDTGWILSCSCVAQAFSKYKEIFNKIISSFRRVQIA